MHDFQKIIAQFCADHHLDTGVEHRLLDVMSELGELAKELLKATNYGKKSFEDKTPEMELELGDCLFSLICLANSLDINLSEALNKIMAKYHSRLAKKQQPGSD